MQLRTATSTNQTFTKRLVVGFAAFAAAAVVGVTGIAGASPDGKPSPQTCAKEGFQNYGQCVKEWAKNKPGQGYGGGGSDGNHIETDVNVEVNGDNNIVQIFLNYIIG